MPSVAGTTPHYLPIDEDDFWRVLLVKALEALRVEGQA